MSRRDHSILPARGVPRCVSWFVIALVVTAVPVLASDWPQWRGPSLDGKSSETGVPLSWSDSDEKVAGIVWKAPMAGVSGATPIVSGDSVFLNVALEDDLELWALSSDDGAVRWKRHLGSGNYKRMKHNMSSPSPVTDGETVWVMSGTGIIKAFDFAGNEAWSRDLQTDYGAFGLNHGYGASPLLDEGVLYVPVIHGMKTDEPSYVVAIEAASGKSLWRVERPSDAIMESPDAYTTPLIWSYEGRRELIISGADYVTGHSLDTGAELWRVGGLNPKGAANYRVVASPAAEGNRLFVPSRVSPLRALEGKPAGTPEVLYDLERTTDVPTPIVDDGILYVLGDRGVLSAYEAASGEVIWGPERVAAGTYSASPLLVEGRLYLTSEDGVTTVVSAGRKFEVLAENPLRGYTLSSIAVSGKRLYLRTAEFLYAIEGG